MLQIQMGLFKSFQSFLCGLQFVVAIAFPFSMASAQNHNQNQGQGSGFQVVDAILGASRFIVSPGIAARCTDYLLVYRPYGRALKDLPSCAAALDRTWKAVAPSPTFIIFRSELETLLRDPSVSQYLQDLYIAVSEQRLPNLWTWTLQHSAIAGDKQKALHWLGILFHNDIETMQNMAVEFSQSGGTGLYSAAYTLLNSISMGLTEPFPEGVTAKTRSIYHFYTIAYLAQRLRQQGTAEIYSFMAPFLLNETYEWSFFYLKKAHALKMKFSGHAEAAAALPRPQVHIKDIYFGYAGAAFALQSEVQSFRGLSYDQFSEGYRKNPFQILPKAMESSLPNPLKLLRPSNSLESSSQEHEQSH